MCTELPSSVSAGLSGTEAETGAARSDLGAWRCPLLWRPGAPLSLFDDETPLDEPARRHRSAPTRVGRRERRGLGDLGLEDRVGFLAVRDTPVWFSGAPVRSGDLLVGESIDAYAPAAVDPEMWDLIAPQARQWVAMVPVKFGRQAVARLKPLAQYLAWRVEAGMDVADPALVFRSDDIEYWLHTACGHLAVGTKATYRSALRSIGEYAAGIETACPDRTTPFAAPDPLAPYSRHEFAAILGAIRGLRTANLSYNATVLVATSRGAGLGASDITGLVGTDIEVIDDTVVVNVSGPRPRQVPVLASWEAELLRLAELCGDKPLFRPDRSQIGPRDVERFCRRLVWIDAPPLSVTRIRNTWIVEHLTAGTPIRILAEAAGTAPKSVARYAQYVPRVDDTTARTLLRRGPGPGPI